MIMITTIITVITMAMRAARHQLQHQDSFFTFSLFFFWKIIYINNIIINNNIYILYIINNNIYI